jgi:hypothetical protein
MIIPLFPLQSVLFPGGRLPLRIFEQRYMDMAKLCLKESTSFGICLIAEGGRGGERREEARRAAPGRHAGAHRRLGHAAAGRARHHRPGRRALSPAAPLGRGFRPAEGGKSN